MKRYGKVFLIPLFLLLLIGCSQKPQEEVSIGTNTWPGYESLYLAQEKGFFPETVRMRRMGSASEVLQAFRKGTIDMAALTMDEALLLKDQGYDIKVVLLLDISNGGDAIIAHKDIADVKALKGKRVGFENTALGAYILERALEENNMSFSDITALPAAYADHENFFLNHIVDAVVTFDPARTKLLNAGGKQIFDSSMIPGEIVDVLVVRMKLLKKNKALVKAVIGGWNSAYTMMQQKPAEAAAVIARHQKITPEAFNASLQGLELPGLEKNRDFLTGKTPRIRTTLEKLYRVMKEKHLLSLEGDIQPEDLLFSDQAALFEP